MMGRSQLLLFALLLLLVLMMDIGESRYVKKHTNLYHDESFVQKRSPLWLRVKRNTTLSRYEKNKKKCEKDGGVYLYGRCFTNIVLSGFGNPGLGK